MLCETHSDYFHPGDSLKLALLIDRALTDSKFTITYRLSVLIVLRYFRQRVKVRNFCNY